MLDEFEKILLRTLILDDHEKIIQLTIDLR